MTTDTPPPITLDSPHTSDRGWSDASAVMGNADRIASGHHVHVRFVDGVVRCAKNRDGDRCPDQLTPRPARHDVAPTFTAGENITAGARIGVDPHTGHLVMAGEIIPPPSEADPVGYLTDTAQLIRRRVAALDAPMWRVDVDADADVDRDVWAYRHDNDLTPRPVINDHQLRRVAGAFDHLAPWTPTVALAVAEVLEEAARLMGLSGGRPHRAADELAVQLARSYRGEATA